MDRRFFFGIMFGALLARFLPKDTEAMLAAKKALRIIAREERLESNRVDFLDLRYWGKAVLPESEDHQYSIVFVSKNGYVTAPSPTEKAC
jgi:hypothetical protein